MKKVVLLLGGARSGKSHLAQEMAQKTGENVLFVATGTAGDEEMRHRIAKHQQDRPISWRTLECPIGLGSQISSHLGDARVVIIDCITLLVNNIFARYDEKQFENIPDSAFNAEVDQEIDALIEYLQKSAVTFIIVSNEVGLGIVPDNRLARLYRDCLGRTNQRLASLADEVYMLMAGLPIRIKPHHL